MKSVEYAVGPTAHELDGVVRSKITVFGISVISHDSWLDVPLTTALVSQGCKCSSCFSGLQASLQTFFTISASRDNGLVFAVIDY